MLAASGVDEAVDLAVAALHVGAQLLLGLHANRTDFLRGLCSRRREQLLSGASRSAQLLLAQLLGVGRDSLCLSLGFCEQPPSLLLGLAHDLRGRGVKSRLLKDPGAQPLGLLELGRDSQTSALERRLRLKTRTLNQPARSLLAVGHRTLAGLHFPLTLARHLARAALTKPLTHQLQMTVDLDRVIATPDTAKVPLHHVHRARLTLTARGHRLPRSPANDEILLAASRTGHSNASTTHRSSTPKPRPTRPTSQDFAHNSSRKIWSSLLAHPALE